jgi:putative SOS response-associated peptidase YedK
VRWGLVPSWARDLKIGYKMINARAETVAEKPAYRAAFQRRRCLVVADGFYEWSPMDGKQPYWIGLPDHGPLAFAGLWEHWDDQATGEHIESCTIIVTDANQQMSAIHNRMPVILPRTTWNEWLDPNLHTPEPLQELLVPYEGELLTYPVSRNVNSPRNDFKELMEPLVGDGGLGL